MATLTVSNPPTSGRTHRFTVEQYHRMAETGVFTQDDRIELLNGEIVDLTPIGREHSSTVKRLLAFLRSIDPNQAILSIQDPILLDNRSEPEPDLAVLRFRSDFYKKNLPQPQDVHLIIEVADSSLDVDRCIKIPLYAKAGIPEVWLVNLQNESLELFRSPANGIYQHTQTLKSPATLASLAFPDCVLQINTLFA